jgi:hypothetical protein
MLPQKQLAFGAVRDAYSATTPRVRRLGKERRRRLAARLEAVGRDGAEPCPVQQCEPVDRPADAGA